MSADSEGDMLESQALDIATAHLLRRESLVELGREYHFAASTIHRRLSKWLDQGRFELVDRLDSRTMAHALDTNYRLSNELKQATGIWRAIVANIFGAEAAQTDQYLEDPCTQNAQIAYRAGDELHKALGKIAADYLLNRIQRNTSIGLASGRGVGFTVMGLADLVKERSLYTSGYEAVRIQSLCGGARVGAWATTVARDLDADENVFHLAAILRVPRDNIRYLGGWISTDQNLSRPEFDPQYSLDLVVVGLGQLNTGHHFFCHYGEVQLGAMADPLRRIRELQSDIPELINKVADIGHRLFPVGSGSEFPEDFLKAIDKINGSILAVPCEWIKKAKEIILVAGGAQKVNALAELVSGSCAYAPIDLRNLTLVTDAVTAAEIIKHISNR